MSETMRESLSALMDNEADELEVQRVLSNITGDSELRQTWVRYQLARSAMVGQPVGGLLDISGHVQDAIRNEAIPTQSVSPVQRFLKPLASFAVAASVAAVAVVGGQQIAQLSDKGGYSEGNPVSNTVAASVSAVGMVNSIGAIPVRASYGNQGVPVLQPASRTAYQELARQRMQKYMQEHAEHAALNSPQGLVPFARVNKIKE
ncbi:MAG: sigma-E factor negative regulatory protein [Halioglobus sp.]